jgi:hypothetical protein
MLYEMIIYYKALCSTFLHHFSFKTPIFQGKMGSNE